MQCIVAHNKAMRPFPQKELSRFLSQGVRDVIPKNEVEAMLQGTKALRVKYGIDPTTGELHLGYWAVFRRLKKLQALGHTAVVVLGTFTGRFGDPTGKMQARSVREKRDVEKSARLLAQGVRKLLMPSRTKIVRNADWWDAMPLDAFFRIAANFTTAQLGERDLFEARKRLGKELFVYEFLYPVLQAYDSVAIGADLTIIGSDQLFNELQARKLQHGMGGRPQGIIALTILPGTDGKEKMSQSLGNTIGIFDPPEEQFGALMSVPDGAMPLYAELLSDFSGASIAHALRKGGLLARDAKMNLAENIVSEIHGKVAAAKAKEQFIKRFQKRELPTDIADIAVRSKNIIPVLVETKLASSNSVARRLLRQRGVKLNNTIVINKNTAVGSGSILSVGKRRIVRILRKGVGNMG